MKIKKSTVVHFYFFCIYLAIAACCSLFVMQQAPGNLNRWIKVSVFISVALLLVQTLLMVVIKAPVFSLQYVILIFMYVFYMGQNYLLWIGYDFGKLSYAVAPARFGSRSFIYANKYSLLCIMFTFAGLVFCSLNSVGKEAKAVTERQQDVRGCFYLRFGWLMLVVSMPFEGYSLFTKIYALFTNGYMAARETSDILLLQYMSNIFFAAALLLVMVQKRKKRKQKLFLALVVYECLTLLTGARAMGTVKLLVSFYVYLVSGGKVSLKTILKLAAGAVVFLYALIIIRNFRIDGLGASHFNFGANGSILLDTISEFSITTRTVTAALQNTVKTAGGMSIACAVLSIVPGWSYLFGDGLLKKYYTFHALGQQEWGSAFISDFYFDFGFTGGVVACFVYGIIVGWMCQKLCQSVKQREYAKAAALSYFMAELLFTVRSYLFRLPRYFVYFLVLYMCFYAITQLLQKKGQWHLRYFQLPLRQGGS